MVEYVAGKAASVAARARYESEYEIERNKPMPNRIHGVIQSCIGYLLRLQYGDRFQFGSEVSLATNPPTTPDLCIFNKKKLRLRDIEAKETEMPLTVIEIISPSQSIDFLQDKAWNIYFPIGIGSVWLVVPELKAIQLLLPNDEQYLFYNDTLTDPTTGIQIPVEKVFEDLA